MCALTAGRWEPGELRGSRRVLRAPGGETPPATHLLGDGGRHRRSAEAIKKQTTEFMAEQMRLTLSPEKTAITHVDDGFDFLGWHVKRVPRPGRAHVAITFPSDRAAGDIKHRIKTLTKSNMVNLSLDELIRALNPKLRGWTNYHRHGAAKRCFGYLSYYLWWRVIRWLRKKYPH